MAKALSVKFGRYSLWNWQIFCSLFLFGEKSKFGQTLWLWKKTALAFAEVESTATEVTSLLCHVIVLDARQPLRDWVCGNNQLWCATHEHILNLESLVGPDWNTPVSKLCLKWGCWEFMLACHVFVSKIPELLWAQFVFLHDSYLLLSSTCMSVDNSGLECKVILKVWNFWKCVRIQRFFFRV